MAEPTNPRSDVDLSRLSGRTRSRGKNPAASAKILATGLSATAMLGMTTGYAVAARETAPSAPMTPAQTQGAQTTATDAASTTGNAAAVAPLAPLAPGTTANIPQGALQSTVASQSQAPVVAQPQIVEIPVEAVAPATPGNGDGGWNTQPSKGSN